MRALKRERYTLSEIILIIIFNVILMNLNIYSEEVSLIKKSLQTLKEEKDNVARIAAIKILVKSKEKATIPILKEIIIDKKEDFKLRKAAVESLVEFGKEGIDGLMEIAEKIFESSLLPISRGESRWNKFDEKELPFIIEVINSLTKTKNSEVIPLLRIPMTVKETRSLCSLLLGEIGKPSIPLLLALLEDKDVKTRKNAVIALGKIKDASVVPALIEVLKEDKNAGVRVEAANALGIIGDKKAIPYLEEMRKNVFLEEEKSNLDKIIKLLKEKK